MLGGQGHVMEQHRHEQHQAYTLVVCPAQLEEADFWSLETLGPGGTHLTVAYTADLFFFPI
ncbi:unnamed protein product [Toxocara canis]|uniref:Uncharacterized protein n=1 Tax=Toxocara canis TaxID=6265 RepID=A0A183U9Y8_TOXCA|nr:unnamed protein product [Toxocara canis]